MVLEHIRFGKSPYILILHSDEDIEKDLVNEFKNNKISNRFKSRNYTNKGYDYAIELTTKDIEGLKQKLSNNEKVNKYSIIEYDADDIV